MNRLVKRLDADVLKLHQVKRIRRRDGAKAMLMLLEQYQSRMETMQRSSNAAHLAMFIALHKVGRAVKRELI